MNLRKVVIIVAFLNLAYFGIEFAVALAIGSVPAAGGASTAKPNEHRAILRAIL